MRVNKKSNPISPYILGTLFREFAQTPFFANSSNRSRIITSFLKDEAREHVDSLPVIIECATIILNTTRIDGKSLGTEADALRVNQNLPSVYSEQAKQIGISFTRGFYGLPDKEELPTRKKKRQDKSSIQAPFIWKINKAALVIITALIAVTSTTLLIHVASEYHSGAARVNKKKADSTPGERHTSSNNQKAISKQSQSSTPVAQPINTRPTIQYGMQYGKAREMLGEKGWYPFKPKGLWSSGIYVDPDIAQTASPSYQEFLLDQRRESASWFYNRNMNEVIDCHPQTSQCTMLFQSSNGEEALVTTKTGREDHGIPVIDTVTFRKARVW